MWNVGLINSQVDRRDIFTFIFDSNAIRVVIYYKKKCITRTIDPCIFFVYFILPCSRFKVVDNTVAIEHCLEVIGYIRRFRTAIQTEINWKSDISQLFRSEIINKFDKLLHRCIFFNFSLNHYFIIELWRLRKESNKWLILTHNSINIELRAKPDNTEFIEWKIMFNWTRWWFLLNVSIVA